MRILIAEDDITSRIVLAGVLKKVGHEVVEVVNGTEAWERMQQPDTPKLLILDWMMPEMDGLEVVQRIRALRTDQPPYIIMLTALWEKMNIIAALDSGANDYLVKPCDPGELRARVTVGCRVIELQDTLAMKIQELRQALDQIKTLSGIVPICAACKKIRDDTGYWQQVEIYIQHHTEAHFSHGLCPECAKRLFPELIKKDILHNT